MHEVYFIRLKKVSHSRHKILLIILIGVVLISWINSISGQSNEIPRKISVTLQKNNRRTINVDAQDHRIVFHSDKTKTFTSDHIQFIIQIQQSILSIEFLYHYKNETGNENLKHSLTFNSILEYEDLNNDSRYTPVIDSILQIFPLRFNSSLIIEEIHDNDAIYYHVRTTSDDLSVMIDFFMSPTFLIHDDVVLSPFALKMGYKISNFPFTTNESLVCLQQTMDYVELVQFKETTEKEKKGLGENEASLIFSHDRLTGMISWLHLASIDTISYSVGFSYEVMKEIPVKSEITLYFSYPHGLEIIHDPEVGYQGLIQEIVVTPFYFLGGGAMVFIGLIVLMTKEEYRSYLKNRILYPSSAVHRLSSEDVLENKFRKEIIDIIVENPGIHYRELQRRVSTTASNLSWHIEILVDYKIIHRQIVGKYLLFFPLTEDVPFTARDIDIIKSRTTMETLRIIGDNPGIYQSKIANRLGLDHKTIKYHIDKLLAAKLIYYEQKTRVKYFYPIIRESPLPETLDQEIDRIEEYDNKNIESKIK